MNRIFSKRTMHNTALMVLFAWLFVFASGVANACLLEPPLNSFHLSLAGHSEADELPAVSVAHLKEAVGYGHAVDTPHAPCLKVCDETSQSLPKAQSGVDQTNPGLTPPVAFLWAAAVPVVLESWNVANLRPATPRVPIRIRYARLAL